MKLGHVLFVLILTSSISLVCAGPMPERWWANKTGNEILKQAEAVTADAPFLHGTKRHELIFQECGFEYFKRKTSAGDIETKLVLFNNGRVIGTQFALKDGRYEIDNFSVLTKTEYDDGPRIEDRLGKAYGDGAFTYETLGEETVGTNDCIVISRTMTTLLSNSVVQAIKKEMGVTNLTSYPPVRDYYVRKSDSIILGYLERSASGNVESDLLCDVMTSEPIPDAEFQVPWQPTAIRVSNWQEYPKAVSTALKTRTILERVLRIAAGPLIVASVGALLWMLFKYARKQGRASV